MEIIRMEVGPLATNAYLVKDEAGADGAVIDPGADGKRIAQRCADAGLAPLYIINTHAHPDHIGANAALKAAFPAVMLCLTRAAAARLSDADTDLMTHFGDARPSPTMPTVLRIRSHVGRRMNSFFWLSRFWRMPSVTETMERFSSNTPRAMPFT
jgi:glyoxylase-like metal-dependent hydrolase (beta-lactamase superfamily II)